MWEKKMQGKQGQADYKSFTLLCPSQNIENCKFRGSIFHPRLKGDLWLLFYA